MELVFMLAIAAYITVIDINLLYPLSIPLGASIAYFLSPRTIEDYYDHDYTKYKQSIEHNSYDDEYNYDVMDYYDDED